MIVQMKMALDWLTLPQAGKSDQKYVRHVQRNPFPNLALPRWTHLQSGVKDGMARRSANIISDHKLVVIKLRGRICRASNTKPQQLRRFAVDKLKDRDVASRHNDELDSELQCVQTNSLSLDEKCKKGKKQSRQRVATNTIGYTRKQSNKH
jgi:hypothetical protein